MVEPNTFAGAALDRAAERRRDDRWLAERVADPASGAVVVGQDRVYVAGEPPRPALVAPSAEAVLLGVADGRALFAIDDSHLDGGAPPPGARAIGLREAGAL